MLNHIWLAFFIIAFATGCYQWLLLDDPEIWARLVAATFDTSRLGMEVALGLVGTLCLWLGLFRIAEASGLTNVLAKFLTPLFARLMPEVPSHHPAIGSITMNMAANMIGLDNAATPIGLKAMKELQELNPVKAVASNAQILFLVINTSSVTLLPITVFMYRAQQGAADPTNVYIPILLATSASTFAGILSVAWIQKLRLFDWVILAYFVGFSLLISGVMLYFSSLSGVEQTAQSSLIGNLVLFGIIILFLGAGVVKKVPVYETFIEGAKDGFHVAVKLIPFLVAMLVAIGVFRASGALDGLLVIIEQLVRALGGDTEFVQALPTAFMKPLSGSGARAMMIETMQHYGVDSFPATVSAIIQGSTETTFYVLAVYFGSVGIAKIRYAIACGLLADAVGIITAIMLGYWFF